MSINLKQPEPESKYCNNCGKGEGDASLKGTLVHWPRANWLGGKVRMRHGGSIEPFSFWFYECQYCRAVQTKKHNRLALRRACP